MQSFSLLPPILESQLEAVAWINNPAFSADRSVQIRFSLPAYTVLDDIGHVQVSIREKTTNNIAVNTNVSPDQQVLYIQRYKGPQLDDQDILSYDEITGICILLLPFQCFKDGNLTPGTEYNIQVRFGASDLWCNDRDDADSFDNNTHLFQHSGIEPAEVSGYAWNRFAAWRADQVSGGLFGEWSNTTTLFCYDANDLKMNFSVEPNSFIPDINFTYYLKNVDDSIEKLAVEYRYENFSGDMVCKNLILNTTGTADLGGYQVINFSLPVGRIKPIYLFFEGYTKKNIKISNQLLNTPPEISVLQLESWDRPQENVKFSHNINNATATLSAEEKNDGGLYFQCEIARPTIQNDSQEPVDVYYNIFRINLNTSEVIKLQNSNTMPINSDEWVDYSLLLSKSLLNGVYGFNKISIDDIGYFSFHDFSIEMGEDYIYTVILKYDNTQFFIEPLVLNYTNPGYGRLMKMDSVLLTTKDHQLRLQGNVKLSGLKRNTSDSFQTTIGNQFPFYSRGSEINYRTFNLDGLVTILFDQTSRFLVQNDDGLQWIDDGSMVILNRDIYHSVEYSKNNRRVNNNHPIVRSTVDLSLEDQRGPLTKFDNHIYESQYRFDDTSHTDEMIYIERKFREYVMNWLSDGKPKLFRSETEGNMIVMLTGIGFTPYEASGRMVYQMSCAATEIAEYNNENLLKYDLIAFDLSTASQKKEENMRIDPELNVFHIENNMKQNGSGFYFYKQITVDDLPAVDLYNSWVESDEYELQTLQPLIYMKLFYQGGNSNPYYNIHHGKFISLADLQKEYPKHKDEDIWQELIAKLIRNDILDITDYPELELVVLGQPFDEWIVNVYKRSIFKQFGFNVSLYQLRANHPSEEFQLNSDDPNYEEQQNKLQTIRNLIYDYLNISGLPQHELITALDNHIVSFSSNINNINNLPNIENLAENVPIIIIDKYRNGNQLTTTYKDSSSTALTATIQLESSNNGQEGEEE